MTLARLRFLCAFNLLISQLVCLAQNEIHAWGTNDFRQTEVPAGLSDVIAVSAGAKHSLALRSDGSVIAWGSNERGQSTVPFGLGRVIAIDSGVFFSMALLEDGTIAVWGTGAPAIPPELNDVVAISCEEYDALALRADGTVVGLESQFEPRGAGFSRIFQVPAGLSGVVAISAGALHALALKGDGTVVAWGTALNDRTTVPEGLNGVIAVSASGDRSLALKSDGSVVVWGDTAGFSPPAGLSGVTAISASYVPLALRADGRVVAWGRGSPSIVDGLSGIGGFSAGRHSLAIAGTGGAPPVITCSRRWVTEAANSRPGDLRFFERITCTGSPTVFTATGLPAGLILDGATGVVTGTAEEIGNFDVMLTAANAMGSTTTHVRLIVNGAPRFIGLPPPSLVALGDPVPIFPVGTAYYASGLPPGMSVNSDTGAIQGSVPGIHDLVMTAANRYGEDSFAWTLEISPLTGWGSDTYGQTRPVAGTTSAIGVAVGAGHTVALTEDGDVVAWGWNDSGQTDVPVGVSDAISIAAGFSHTLALKKDGTVAVWGADGFDEPVIVPELGKVMAISAADRCTLYLKSDGTVVSQTEKFGPASYVLPRFSGIVAVTTNQVRTVAITSDRKVVSWRPDGTAFGDEPPDLSGVVDVAVGSFHEGGIALALKEDGTLVAWGSDAYDDVFPAGLTDVIDIAAQDFQFFALRSDGTIVNWGSQGSELGLAHIPAAVEGGVAVVAGVSHAFRLAGALSRPPMITSSRKWLSEVPNTTFRVPSFYQRIVATGGPTSFTATGLPEGLTLDQATGIVTGVPTEIGTFPISIAATNGAGTGTAEVELVVNGLPAVLAPVEFAEAGNEIPFFGIGTSFSVVGLPKGMAMNPTTGAISGSVAGLYDIRATATNAHGETTIDWTLEVSPVNVWGGNGAGQADVPRGLQDVVAISTGGGASGGSGHALAVTANGGVVAWGSNFHGQATVPPGLGKVIAVSAGYQHSLALQPGGTVKAWGQNFAGQCTVPAGLRDVVAIAAGDAFSVALKSDGTLAAWGSIPPAPSGMVGVTAISVGPGYPLALKSDGTISAWPGSPQVPELTGVTAVFSAGGYSLARKSDGSIVAWGQSDLVRSTPEHLENVVDISIGSGHALALKEDGSVIAWKTGSFAYEAGQTAIPPFLKHVAAISASGSTSMALVRVPPAPGFAVEGQPFSFAVKAAVALPAYSATGLPPGLEIDSVTGIISGTPAERGIWRAVITMGNRASTVHQTLRITVASADAVSYEEWALGRWSEGDSNASGIADPDADGIANALEFAVGTDPLSANVLVLSPFREADGHLVLFFDVSESAFSAVGWEAEFADTLDFSENVYSEPISVPGAAPGFVRLRFDDQGPQSSRRCGRVNVTIR